MQSLRLPTMRAEFAVTGPFLDTPFEGVYKDYSKAYYGGFSMGGLNNYPY